MVIEDEIEEKVRAALDAVVKRSDDRLDDALRALDTKELRLKGLELAVAICAVVIFDTFEGRPTVSAIREVSIEVAEMEQWSSLGADDVESILSAIVERRPINRSLDSETAFMATFIVAGTLLAASPRIGKDEWWFNYLDRVEAAIEAATSS